MQGHRGASTPTPDLGFSALTGWSCILGWPQHARGSDPDHMPALAAIMGLTDGTEEVTVLGEGHEGLGQLPQPLLEHPGDGMDREVLQLDCCRVLKESGQGW